MKKIEELKTQLDIDIELIKSTFFSFTHGQLVRDEFECTIEVKDEIYERILLKRCKLPIRKVARYSHDGRFTVFKVDKSQYLWNLRYDLQVITSTLEPNQIYTFLVNEGKIEISHKSFPFPLEDYQNTKKTFLYGFYADSFDSFRNDYLECDCPIHPIEGKLHDDICNENCLQIWRDTMYDVISNELER